MRLQKALESLELSIEKNGFEVKSFVAGYVLGIETNQLLGLYDEIMAGWAYNEDTLPSVVVVTHLRRELAHLNS